VELVEIVEPGISCWKGPAEYGRQDLGYSPGGALDRASRETGNLLLGNDDSAPALEMVVPPVIRFREDCCFALTGGGLDGTVLKTASGLERPVRHAAVEFAPAASRLEPGRRSYGFRTYLCLRPAPRDPKRLIGRKRGDFRSVFHWPDEAGTIRLVEGPEFRLLEDGRAFFRIAWRTSTDMSDMGIRLEPAGSPAAGPAGAGPPAAGPPAAGSPVAGSPAATSGLGVAAEAARMISGPVADGTVQLTPGGPIILLRQRQTVGGYPRIFNVISADVDLLAQYAPHQRMRFCLISLNDAWRIARDKRKDMEALKSRFTG